MNCPSCFDEAYDSIRCRRCGYEAGKLHVGISLPLGSRLKNGEYQIGKVLGKRGGFGITYLGWNVQLETKVAIKEYLPLQIAGRGAGTVTVSVHAEENSEVFEYGLKSFLEEARTLAQLRHDCIVRVQNFFRENGTAYMVMEYLEGQSLEEYLAKIGRVTAPDAVALFLPVLDGLAYMHQKNILHRDIKPANIYLTEEGKAILFDFGAARQAVQEKSPSMTAIMTPGYAPWEQYHRKGQQGPWTDVYACAATLYRMVTGQNPPESAERIVEDDIVPVDRLVPGIDATIAAGIMAGLEMKIEARTQSAMGLVKHLQENKQIERKTENKESIITGQEVLTPSSGNGPGKIIAIDLGTTNSIVAVMKDGKPVVITNAEGSRLTPSVVGFSKSGERLVGQVAKQQAISNPERTISSIKRELGSNYSVTIDDKKYSPQELSAMVLGKLKNDAEAYLGTKVTQAIITVPAGYSYWQRRAVIDSARSVGLEVMHLINNTSAAALAYGIDKDDEHTILVFDLGGGTFDVSILELGAGVFEVKSTSGNSRLGGDDFDERVMKWLIREFKKESGIDLSNDKIALQRLKEAAEKVKIELSSLLTTNITLPFITADARGPKQLDLSLTRAKFDELTTDLVEATIGLTRQVMADAGLSPKQIDKIILVGGSSRIPAVQDAIKKFFGNEAHISVSQDVRVAVGAAIQAGVFGGEVRDVLLLEVTTLSLGIETLGGVFSKIIERNTTIPTAKSLTFSTANDNQPSVDVHVLQGESERAAENKTIGRFELSGIAPSPRGVPQIEVTFDIDYNSIVHVSAKDLCTSKERKIKISAYA